LTAFTRLVKEEVSLDRLVKVKDKKPENAKVTHQLIIKGYVQQHMKLRARVHYSDLLFVTDSLV
jgi:hypothetical protein